MRLKPFEWMANRDYQLGFGKVLGNLFHENGILNMMGALVSFDNEFVSSPGKIVVEGLDHAVMVWVIGRVQVSIEMAPHSRYGNSHGRSSLEGE
jgi:hypothetical protein